MCVLFLSFARKKKIPKRKGTGYVYGATPILPCADGAQTRYAQTVGPSGNNADSQTPSITKTPADVDKYIYISELVLVTVFSAAQVVDFIDSEINL